MCMSGITCSWTVHSLVPFWSSTFLPLYLLFFTSVPNSSSSSPVTTPCFWRVTAQRQPCCLLHSVCCFPSPKPWPVYTQHTHSLPVRLLYSLSVSSLLFTSLLFSSVSFFYFSSFCYDPYLLSSQLQCLSKLHCDDKYTMMNADTYYLLGCLFPPQCFPSVSPFIWNIIKVFAWK